MSNREYLQTAFTNTCTCTWFAITVNLAYLLDFMFFLIHSTKILKGHRYISHRVYAMNLQLWHPVFSRCFDKFQQNLQEVLSKVQFTISSENDLCPGPIDIHGIKKRKLRISEIQDKNQFYFIFIWNTKKIIVSLSSTLINICTFHCVQFLRKKNQFPEQEKKTFEK